MAHSIVEVRQFTIPQEFEHLLCDPPLVGSETVEDYNRFFSAIASAAMPRDFIDWIYVKSCVDISWNIRRERSILADIVKSAHKSVVLDLLKSTLGEAGSLESAVYRTFDAAAEAARWANDPEARKDIDARLTAKGHPPGSTLAQAYLNASSQVDAVQKRIDSYEVQRMMLFREIERRGDRLARDLSRASSDIVDGEFSEAAE